MTKEQALLKCDLEAMKAILDCRAELRIYNTRGDKESALYVFKRLMNLYSTLNISEAIQTLEALESNKEAA